MPFDSLKIKKQKEIKHTNHMHKFEKSFFFLIRENKKEWERKRGKKGRRKGMIKGGKRKKKV